MAKSMDIRGPQDIIDIVIEAVGDDTHLLKQCTLVSSSFLLPAHKQLFSSITLKSDQTCQGINQLLYPKSLHSALYQNHYSQWNHWQLGSRISVDEWDETDPAHDEVLSDIKRRFREETSTSRESIAHWQVIHAHPDLVWLSVLCFVSVFKKLTPVFCG
jgi:hypothetical protein